MFQFISLTNIKQKTNHKKQKQKQKQKKQKTKQTKTKQKTFASIQSQ